MQVPKLPRAHPGTLISLETKVTAGVAVGERRVRWTSHKLPRAYPGTRVSLETTITAGTAAGERSLRVRPTMPVGESLRSQYIFLPVRWLEGMGYL